MLFNSYPFIFVFLPLTWAGFFILNRFLTLRAALAWLVAASFVYYGWFIPQYIWILALSIVFNFWGGRLVSNRFNPPVGKVVLGAFITGNLLLLGYFKYANFFLDNLGYITGSAYSFAAIALPLGISFFTFQQIAYLVDSYRGQADNRSFLEYCVFVTFFPQLIAGPIVHHAEIIPQLTGRARMNIRHSDFAIGISIFTIGLFKKVCIADTMAAVADPGFGAAAQGVTLSFSEAWIATIAFGLEIYFDFSAYSDMAIGLARLFGIRLPENFNSPYKAVSIIDFWHRWHITLSRFLRDYLYFPLGGNRQGKGRRYTNLMIVMLLGGLWHGAAWTFITWGALHGLFLVINHGWRALRAQPMFAAFVERNTLLHASAWRIISWSLTMTAVFIAWVFFRAENWTAVEVMLMGMTGQTGFDLPRNIYLQFGHIWQTLVNLGVPTTLSVKAVFAAVGVFGLAFIVLAMPNTQQSMARFSPVLRSQYPPSTGDGRRTRLMRLFEWRPSITCAIAMSLLALVNVMLLINDKSEFIYFQF